MCIYCIIHIYILVSACAFLITLHKLHTYTYLGKSRIWQNCFHFNNISKSQQVMIVLWWSAVYQVASMWQCTPQCPSGKGNRDHSNARRRRWSSQWELPPAQCKCKQLWRRWKHCRGWNERPKPGKAQQSKTWVQVRQMWFRQLQHFSDSCPQWWQQQIIDDQIWSMAFL